MTALSDLSCKIRSRKGVNVHSTGSRVSQPVAQSGCVAGLLQMDELPLITWTGLTVSAGRRGAAVIIVRGGKVEGCTWYSLSLYSRSSSWLWIFPLTELTSVLPAPALPSTPHQYVYSLPSSSVILYSLLLTCWYRPNFQPDCKNISSDVSTVA